MTFQDLADGDKEIVSAIHHMLVAGWAEAAELAWISYQAHGRGAVLLDFRPYESPPETLPFAGYARQQDVSAGDEDLSQLKDLLETYRPEKEVVFVIYTPLGDTIIELLPVFGGQPTPPEAAGDWEIGP